jgi:dihydrodipicolinate synthase/N-acetylneuraminate lyase
VNGGLSPVGLTSARWHGIYPSLPTPFAGDDSLDLEAMRRVVRFATDSGAHGLICFGLAGEVFRLTPGERIALLEVIIDETDGHIPIFAGVGTEALHTSMELARAAAKIGADGVVVPPPITVRASEAELLRYFETIADAAGLPVMVQDAPEYLRVELGPALIAKLASRCDNLRLVKLEGGPEVIREWVERLAGTAGVFGGNGGIYLLDCLEAGAVGVAPGTDLVDLLVEVFDIALASGRADAQARFQRLLPTLVFQLQDINHFNASSKHVLVRRGVLHLKHLRSPAAKLSPHGYTLLDEYLADLGLHAREAAQ